MAITNPITWNDSQLDTAESVLKAVWSEPLLQTNGESAHPNGPRIITSFCQLWKLPPECLTADIIVGDLDTSFPEEDRPEKEFILPPLHYRAPELITQHIPIPPNMSTDVWTLALTFFVMRSGTLLFPRTKDINKMFIIIWLCLGDSQRLSELWTEKDEYVDDDGDLMVYTPIRNKLLKDVVEDIGREVEGQSRWASVTSMSTSSDASLNVPGELIADEWPPVPITPREAQMFHDLLSKMLQVDPRQRIKIEEVLMHPVSSANCVASYAIQS